MVKDLINSKINYPRNLKVNPYQPVACGKVGYEKNVI